MLTYAAGVEHAPHGVPHRLWRQRRYSVYLLYSYKSTNTDAARVPAVLPYAAYDGVRSWHASAKTKSLMEQGKIPAISVEVLRS